MILLRRPRLLFIKGAKVAGTSIEVFLSRYAEEGDIVTPILPPSPLHRPRNYLGADGEPLYYNHIDAARVRELLGPAYFSTLRRFGVVRDPFEKVKSTFAMQYVRNSGDYDVDRAIDDTWSEADKYCSASGECLLTDVLRYEELEDGLRRLLGEVGIAFERLTIAEKADYRRQCPVEPMFTAAQRDRIAGKFSWEFANFYRRAAGFAGGAAHSTEAR